MTKSVRYEYVIEFWNEDEIVDHLHSDNALEAIRYFLTTTLHHTASKKLALIRYIEEGVSYIDVVGYAYISVKDGAIYIEPDFDTGGVVPKFKVRELERSYYNYERSNMVDCNYR